MTRMRNGSLLNSPLIFIYCFFKSCWQSISTIL